MKIKNNGTALLLFLGILWLVFGCADTDSDGGQNQQRRQAQTDSAPAAISVHAGKLVLDYEGNEVRANQMYGGKRVRVNGTVNSIEVTKDGDLTLTFHSPAGGYAMTQCWFDKSQSSRLGQFQGGNEAIVEGTVRGFSGPNGRSIVFLENCILP